MKFKSSKTGKVYGIAPQTWRILTSLRENHEFGGYEILEDGTHKNAVINSKILKEKKGDR